MDEIPSCHKVFEMPAAIRDLDDILSYVQDDLQVPGTAVSLLDAYDEAVKSLKFSPYRCTSLMERGLKHYRVKEFENYLIFYVVKEELKIVEVRRIFHSKQNYRFLLRK